MKKGTAPKSQPPKSVSRPTTSVKKSGTSALSVNEEFLKRTLRLLGVTDAKFEKQTKSVFKHEFFPKTVPNPTNSKQFFYITFVCALNLVSKDEEQELKMWYPPRTVNQQIEFKKTLFKILQRLESHGLVPKNLLISKMVLMGEGNALSLLQFLRIFAELSLRALYLEKYSKKQRLIQIAVNNVQSVCENDINKFYVFPFNEAVTNVEPPVKSQVEADTIKNLFKVYIDRYRKKILSLRTVQEVEGINPQSLMSQILQQKQVANTLQTKVSKSIYTENRAFDRRIILDKNAQIWKELSGIPCSFIEEGQNSVLKVEGETSKALASWRPVGGTPNIIDVNSERQKLKSLKTQCQQKIVQLKQLNQKWLSMLKNANKQ